MRNFIKRLQRIYNSFPRIHFKGISSLVLFLTMIAFWSQNGLVSNSPDSILRIPAPNQSQLSNMEQVGTSQIETWSTKHDQIRPGDSLSKLFTRQRVSLKILDDIMRAEKGNLYISRIKAGQIVEFRSINDELKEVALIQSPFRQVVASQTNTLNWIIEDRVREPDIYIEHVVGSINSSLFQAGTTAGLPDNLIMDLANIFGHVIDFVNEIRKGDKFIMTFEKRYLDGEFIEYGNILAAEFVNNKESFKAVRFADSTGRIGYFDEKGISLRKAFLRAPLNFRRISSNFTHSRRHPITGVRRPHKGTDYAAPTGTPVYASGDGKILFRNIKGGYGKTVIIKHGSNVRTLYAHLSRYGKFRVGQKVMQGDIIGYVGSTGLSTGPHLHYEFIFNGVHRNPRTIFDKLPKAESLPQNEMKSFRRLADPLLASLQAQQNAELAYQEMRN